MNRTSERVYGLDILKAVCAFLVITIHAPFPGVPGSYVMALARIAVPIFFMITGYFYPETRQKGKERNQIRKIFQLFLLANLSFLLWEIFKKAFIKKISPMPFLSAAFHWKSILRFLIFNDSPFGEHLWYLGAVLYVLGIVYFLHRVFPKSADKILFTAAPVLLAANFLLGNDSWLLFHSEQPLWLTRNFLYTGIPYFSVGLYLGKHKQAPANSGKQLCILANLAFLFAYTTIWEENLLSAFHPESTRDHYLSTLFLSITVFQIFENPFWNHRLPLLSRIGRNCSTWVYIIHPLVVNAMIIFLERTPIYGIYSSFQPVIIYLFSVLAGAIWHSLSITRTRYFKKI